MWQYVTLTVLLNLILATWALWGIWQVKERRSVWECTVCMCMAVMHRSLLFCDCYLQSHTPLHPVISSNLYLLFTPPPPQPVISPSSPSLSSGPWHYPSSTTLPTGEPYRLPVSTGTPLLFCWMSPANGEMTRTKCVSICTKQKECCHGWLNWNTTLRTHLITNKQWTLQIHKFAAKHLQVFVRFLLFWQHHQREWHWLHKEITVNWHLARGHSCWLGPEQPPSSNLHSSGIMLSAGCGPDKMKHGLWWAKAHEKGNNGSSSSLSGRCQGGPLTTHSFLKTYLEVCIWILPCHSQEKQDVCQSEK